MPNESPAMNAQAGVRYSYRSTNYRESSTQSAGGPSHANARADSRHVSTATDAAAAGKQESGKGKYKRIEGKGIRSTWDVAAERHMRNISSGAFLT
eukprot:1168164-Pleurochrysis_carterae.AAC.1